MRGSRESGQTAVEYLLVVSVASIALIGGAFTFYPQFRDGVASLASDVETMLETHELPSMLGGGSVFGNPVAPSPASPSAPATEDPNCRTPDCHWDMNGTHQSPQKPRGLDRPTDLNDGRQRYIIHVPHQHNPKFDNLPPKLDPAPGYNPTVAS